MFDISIRMLHISVLCYVLFYDLMTARRTCPVTDHSYHISYSTGRSALMTAATDELKVASSM